MKPLKYNSFKKLAYMSAIVIVVLLCVSTIVNVLLLRFHYKNHENERIHEKLENKAILLGKQLRLYHKLIANAAAGPGIKDLLLFLDPNAAHKWAVNMRKYLPQSIGIALLTNHGEVLGDPVALRLGPQCLTDLTRLSQGEVIGQPLIHRPIPGLSHFDLTTLIYDENDKQIGALFVSFSLDTLKTTLQEIVGKAELLQLIDARGEPIAVAGSISPAPQQYSLSMPVPESTWAIKITKNPASVLPIYLTLGLSNLLISLLVIGLILFLIFFALKVFKSDYEEIKKCLIAVSEGKFDEESPNIRLKESAKILPYIEYLSRDIQKQQQMIANQSWVDELTGLPNQRHFNHEFIRAYNLARRGIPMALVLIDLDNFKTLTLSAGIAAGNQSLKLLANTLRQCCRKTDFAARLSGDEFALLLLNMQPDKIRPCLEKLTETFLEKQARHPVVPDDLRCTLSCGFTFINVHRDYDAAAVLTRADKTLESAKSRGKNCVLEA